MKNKFQVNLVKKWTKNFLWLRKLSKMTRASHAGTKVKGPQFSHSYHAVIFTIYAQSVPKKLVDALWIAPQWTKFAAFLKPVKYFAYFGRNSVVWLIFEFSRYLVARERPSARLQNAIWCKNTNSESFGISTFLRKSNFISNFFWN